MTVATEKQQQIVQPSHGPDCSITVEFRNVSKFYGEVLGVNRVNLVIPPGITSLVGPNGSGKTTLMNLVTGTDSTHLRRRARVRSYARRSGTILPLGWLLHAVRFFPKECHRPSVRRVWAQAAGVSCASGKSARATMPLRA